MAYHLQFHDERVERYLRERAGLSPEGIERVFRQLDLFLGEQGDHYRAEAGRRLQPDSPVCFLDLQVPDVDADGNVVLRWFWFLVNDRAAENGVLILEYADSGLPPHRMGG
jgi:hypothetical protein